MTLTRLKVLPQTSPSVLDHDQGPWWRWCPDAKLMPAADGEYNVCNFANGKILKLARDQGRLLAGVSGISIPFQLPVGIDAETVKTLRSQRTLLPEDGLTQYEADIRAQIAQELQASCGLIIMPTEKCNYRCTYCYESFEKGRMSEAAMEAVSKAVARVARSAQQFNIAFFGGEPLLCPDLVLRLSREAVRVCAQRGIRYQASVTTNAHFLTPELFGELCKAGVVAYQITVDGDRELHDKQRVLAGGGPTFDRIVGHIQAMSRSTADFICAIRCNVRPEHQARIFSLFDQDLRMLRKDRRFAVDWHNIWSSDRQDMTALAGPASTPCVSEAVRPLNRFAFNRELEARGMRTGLYSHGLSGLAGGCYAGKPNWFVIGSDLSLYKCTVVFDREENKVGRVNDDGTFTVDERKQALWTGSNALTDSSCGTCHLRVPCSGLACPLARFSEGHKKCPTGKTTEALRTWSQQRPAEDQGVRVAPAGEEKQPW